MADISVDAQDVVEDSYAIYGEYVNGWRANPKIEDGLKAVERRLIQTALIEGARKDFKSSAKIVGACLGSFHPHGDTSVYESLVKAVRRPNPPFIGQGNFGYTGLTSTGEAAMRYTSVKLSDLALQWLTAYEDYGPSFVNELQSKELEYFPVPIPYALMSGAHGIGLGTATRIPALTAASLSSWVTSHLNGTQKSNLMPDGAGGEVVYQEQDLERFNKTGFGTFMYKARVQKMHSEIDGKTIIRVDKIPRYINPARLLAGFRKDIEAKSIYVRDESDENGVSVVLGRSPYIRTIGDDDIAARAAYYTSMNIGFRTIVSHDNKSRSINPHDWLGVSMIKWLNAYKSDIDKQWAELQDEILFNSIKKDLARLLLEERDDVFILKYFATRPIDPVTITQVQLTKFVRKAISTLRSPEEPIDKFNARVAALQSQLSNINAAASRHLKPRWALLK